MANGFTVADHFEGKEPVVQAIYDRLLKSLRQCGEVYEAPKKAPVLSFAERDEMLKRQRWEEMTGRKWPEPGERRLQLL